MAALGHAVGSYDAALTYCRRRHQFGKPLVSFQIVQEKLVRMLAEVTAMQLYCLRVGRLADRSALKDTIAGLAKMNNTSRARQVIAQARDLLGGNGILLENHVIRHMADIEAIHTFEGTETIQALIVGREITGVEGVCLMATDTTSKGQARGRGDEAAPGLRPAARAGLDVMLSDAALEDGGLGRFLKPRAGGRTIAGLARHPGRTARDAGGLGAELARVATGRSEVTPAKGDRRFGDRAWQENWLLHGVMQGYLATCETVDHLISDAGLDWRTERQARFAATNVLDALAPTNFPGPTQRCSRRASIGAARTWSAADGGSCAM